jgi:hypothetical protein
VSIGSNIWTGGLMSTGAGLHLSDSVIIGGNNCQNFNNTSQIGSCVVLGIDNFRNVTGGLSDGNIIIGKSNANNWTNGDNNNILIASRLLSPASESNTIRLGNPTYNNTACYISGIHTNSQPNTATSTMVSIDSDGHLTKGMMPLGELSFEDFITPYTLSTPVVGTFYEISQAMTLITNFSTKFNQSANGRIQYTGTDTCLFHCAVSLSAEPTTNNDTCSFQLHKNGVKIPNSKIKQKFGNAVDWNNSAQHTVVELSTNDYVSIFASNDVSTTGITFGNINLLVIHA